MKPEYIYAFYEYALLPQFGIENEHIAWHGSHKLGPDETAHLFSTDTSDFILIFEDYDGLGRDPSFIEETLRLKSDTYAYVKPKSQTSTSPSLRLTLPTPYKYAPNITGSFTLLKMHDASNKDNNGLIRLNITNDWGWVRTESDVSE